MDPNKAYEIGRHGDEQRFRSLIQDALSEGNEAVASWLIDKVKAAHEGSFKDIIEEAVEYANAESETYKPTDLAKKYWNEYFGPEPANDEEIRQMQKEAPLIFGKPEDEQQNLEPIGTLPKDDNRPLWVGKDGQVHIGEPGEEYTKQYGELDPHIRKALDDFASNNSHFGEEQAEGLSNLLEGLRDTPHDSRW